MLLYFILMIGIALFILIIEDSKKVRIWSAIILFIILSVSAIGFWGYAYETGFYDGILHVATRMFV